MFIPCSNKIGNCFALEIVVKGTVSQNKVWRFIICDVYRAGGSDDISLCVGVMFCSLGLVGLMISLCVGVMFCSLGLVGLMTYLCV